MILPKLAGSDTSSLSVNQYRRINFWMAILGQILIPFPAFFDVLRICEKRQVAIFPANHRHAHIFILLFTPLLGIKRRARLIKKAHEKHLVTPLPAGLSSLYIQNSATTCFDVVVVCLALACRWPVSGQCGGDTR